MGSFGLPFVKAATQDQAIGVLAVGGQDAEALIVDRKLIDDLQTLEIWITRLCSAIAGAPAGWDAREAQRGAEIALEAGDQIRAVGDGVAWVAIDTGEIALMGSNRICRAGDPFLPLAAGTWAEARVKTRARVVNAALKTTDIWLAADQFHELAMGVVAERIASAADAERHRLHQRAQQSAIRGKEVLNQLMEVLAPARVHRVRAEGADPLLEVCQLVAEAGGAHVTAPPTARPGRAHCPMQRRSRNRPGCGRVSYFFAETGGAATSAR